MQRNKIFPIIVITILCFFFLVGLITDSIAWVQGIILFITLYTMMLLGVKLLKPKDKLIVTDSSYKPFVSIMVPCSNEEAVIASTLTSILGLDYAKYDGTPNFEVLVIDDGSTDQTYQVVSSLKEIHPNLKILKREYPEARKGKSAALNQGIKLCEGEVICVFDADTRIEPNFLKKSIPLLAESSVAGVQSRVRIYNAKHNWLTQNQEVEFGTYVRIMQEARDSLGGACGLGGNGQLVKRDALLSVGGWNEESLTEDLDLSIRLYIKGLNIRYCDDAIVWQEAVETTEALIRQRKRWAMGFIHSLYTYFDKLFTMPVSPFKRADQMISLVAVVLPLFLVVMYSYYAFTGVFDIFFGGLIANRYLTLLSIAFYGLLLVAFLQAQEEKNLFKVSWKIFSFGIYSLHWVLVIPAALWESFASQKNRFRWVKTEHSGGSRSTAAES